VNATKSMMVGQIDTMAEYSLTFELVPTGLIESWSNILHFGSIDNIRAPAIFFQKRNLKLHARVGTRRDSNRGCDSDKYLLINQVYFVNLTVHDEVMTFHVDGDLICRLSVPDVQFYADQTVYISNPHYHAAMAKVRNMRITYFQNTYIYPELVYDKYMDYKILTNEEDLERAQAAEAITSNGKFPETTKCKARTLEETSADEVQLIGCDWLDIDRSIVLGMIDMPLDFRIHLEVQPTGHSNKESNLLKIGSHPDIHFPSIWFKPRTLTLIVKLSSEDGLVECQDKDEFVLNKPSTVVVEVRKNKMKVLVSSADGMNEICDLAINLSHDLKGQAIYVSEPVGVNAPAKLRNFKLYFPEEISAVSTLVANIGKVPFVSYKLET